MTSLNTIKRTIAVAIATDPAIEAHCQEKYGKSITVAIGLDLKALPKAASVCPWAGISIAEYQRANSGKTSTFQLDSAVYIQNETISADPQYPSILIAEGNAAIETLSDLVYAAIQKAVSTSSTQTTMTYQSEGPTKMGMTDLPEFGSFRTWTIGIKP
jgi:hypothetical protein